ncbi:DUF3320 domain-containing protein [Alkalilimnicola ehrlichii]|uniref:DUF3320 domain-containing protein n=1 Tax=Alkalilimnicola ehrlichii TaxID=351052 RepID=UPI003B9F2124
MDPAGLGLGGTDSFHDIGDEALDRAIRQVVWVEGPVHVLVLADRLLTGAGVARLGSRIRGRIEGRLARLETAGELALCHAFIARPRQFVLPPYRDWRTAPGKTRQLDHVHDGELMLCLLHAVLAAEGIAVDDALNNGLHRIGFTRLTTHAHQRLQAPLQALLDEGMLDNEDNRLHLGPEAFLRRIRSR